MRCTSFFPGYYYARDLIPGATGIPWPQLNRDITRKSGTGDNVPLRQSSIDHCMGYAKEVMRQAMLEHEAVFRYQVHELHRLYRRQKELMDEFQRRYIQLQMSQMDPSTYPMQSDISQKPLHVAGWPFVNARGCDPSMLSAEKFHGPLVALHSEQGDTNPPSKMENGKKEPKVLPSITNKLGKRMLDLELPADLYVDSEEEEDNVEENVEVPQIQCYPPKETSGFESDPKLSSSQTIGSPSLNLSYRRPTCLVDLNEPFQLDESDTLNSPCHAESATCCMEIIFMDQDLSQKSDEESEVLDGGRGCTIQVGKDIDACSKIIHLEGRQVEPLPHNSEAGLDGAALNALERVSSSERTILGSKFSEDGHDLHAEVHPKTLSSSISSSHQLVPQSAEPKTKALCSISSRKKSIQDLRKIPEAVQALPCFNNPGLLDKNSKSASESSKNNREMLCSKNNSASNPSFGNVSSYPTASSDNDLTSEVGSPSKRFKNSDYMKSSGDMDLNHMPPRWSSEMVAPQENDRNRDDANDIEDLVKALGWHRKSCSDGGTLGFSDLTKSNNFDHQFPALDPASCTLNPFECKDIENNEKMGKIDSTAACDAISMSVECSKGDLDVGIGMGNVSKFKASILLNSCRNEDDPSPASREGDLEAPVSPENKERSPQRGESENLQLEISVHLSKEDCHRVGELDKIAAEAIISMSSSGVQLCLEAVTNRSSKFRCDCLDWFAGVVSSVAEENDVEELLNCASVSNHKNDFEELFNGASVSNQMELKSVGNDYFVASKSKLKEIKAEPLCYRSNDQNDEETSVDFLPTPRGRGRRAKKSRVFKKKALHSLGVLKGATTGAALDNVTKRKRNMGENGFTKRRPHLNIVHCNGLEQFMCSHSTRAAKNADRGRFLGGWGLTKGQRKARSARSGFHDFPPLADFHQLSS